MTIDNDELPHWELNDSDFALPSEQGSSFLASYAPHKCHNENCWARQALPMMRPMLHQIDLHELAQTASFLGDAQVRILNEHRHVLADSGHRTRMSEFMWVVTGMSDHQLPGMYIESPIMVFPSVQVQVFGTRDEEPWVIFEQLPPDAEFTIVRRMEGA
ncbi:MAG: hypothetical protein GY832_35180 [Chloroflexi bacterium]|nr:hypothetical protein [Chloroflexota bacterium]